MHIEIPLQSVAWIILQKTIKSNHCWFCFGFGRKTFTFDLSFSKAEAEKILPLTLAYEEYKLLFHSKEFKSTFL